MKNILDKINRADEIQSKVELGTHEVELGIIQDIIAEYQKGISAFQQGIDLEDKVKIAFKNALVLFTDIDKMILKVENSARETGIEIPRDTLTL